MIQYAEYGHFNRLGRKGCFVWFSCTVLFNLDLEGIPACKIRCVTKNVCLKRKKQRNDTSIFDDPHLPAKEVIGQRNP